MVSEIRAIVFDLDGTLYINDDFANEIKRGACDYIAGLKGISADSAASLIAETRKRLSCERGQEATLSAVCSELGGSVAGFHATVTPLLYPESLLKPDGRVTALITRLSERYELYLYTNNNRTLTDRILKTIKLSGLFGRIFTIEDFWQPKPDREVLNKIFSTIRKNPAECLFVGDRHDVDLKLPAEMGCSTFLVTNIQGLLELANFNRLKHTTARKAR
jgi:putative hydrolase of the HAD superfamily